MTAYIEVLTEGASDVPVVETLLQRHFGLRKGEHFRVHPHQGRGHLPINCLAMPDPKRRGLLDQLPAKLRGMAHLPESALVLVLVDADNDGEAHLLAQLQAMLMQLPKRPARVLFRLAVEETESWFLADRKAMRQAWPHIKLRRIQGIAPDAVVGAWERLAEALGVDVRTVTGSHKLAWAREIAPYLDFENAGSPSLQKLVQGTRHYLDTVAA
jgi:hypothetical protein